MKSLPQVMEEYRLADLDTRLNLYLDCPELRQDFMAIEMEEDARLATAIKQPEDVDWIDKIMANLFNAFPLSWQTRLKRNCCG